MINFNRNKIFIIIFINLFIFSECKNDNAAIEITIIEKKILNKETLKKEFYEDGKLGCKYVMLNGKRHGKYIAFHPNGIIKEESFYDNNNLTGISKFYYDNGNTEMEREWVVINNKSQPNGSIYYDKNGKPKYSDKVNISKDCNKNDTCDCNIKISSLGSEFQKMEVYLGKFNENYTPINTTVLDTIRSETYTCLVKINQCNQITLKGITKMYGKFYNRQISKDSLNGFTISYFNVNLKDLN